MKGDIIVRLVVPPGQDFTDEGQWPLQAENWAWFYGTTVGPIGKHYYASEAIQKLFVAYFDWARTGKEIVWTETSLSEESSPPSPHADTTTAPGTRDTKSGDPQVLEQLPAEP